MVEILVTALLLAPLQTFTVDFHIDRAAFTQILRQGGGLREDGCFLRPVPTRAVGRRIVMRPTWDETLLLIFSVEAGAFTCLEYQFLRGG